MYHILPSVTSPIVINWHVTEACNFRCRYCYAKWQQLDGRELIRDPKASNALIEALYEGFAQFNTMSPPRLNFAGGEPLLYGDQVVSAMARARELGFDVSLISNGSRLTADLAARIAPHLTILGISIDATTSATNERIGRLDGRGIQLDLAGMIDHIAFMRSLNPAMTLKVNTVVNDDGKLIGYNTDMTGFIQALLDQGFNPADREVVLLGAGGAARAVVWGLIKAGARGIHIGVRSPEKVQPLVDEFHSYGVLDVCHWESQMFQQWLQTTDLLVNTTPLGMTPHLDGMAPVDWSKVNPSAFAYDIIYTPAETRFLREARLRGHVTLNGEAMLAGQGAAAFQLWTGVRPDLSLMKQKLRKALQ